MSRAMFRPLLCAVLAAAALVALPTRAETLVTWVAPEKFTDVGRDRLHSDRDSDLAMLRSALIRRADAVLPKGDRLEIWITDVDQAGDFEPWRTPMQDLRVVRDIYPPRVDLRFRWTGAGGELKKEGERKLTDPAFLLDSSARTADTPMRHEMALLNRWLLRELKP